MAVPVVLPHRCCTGRCLMVVSYHLITCSPSSTVSRVFCVIVSWSRCCRTVSQHHLFAPLPQLCMHLYARVSVAVIHMLLLLVVYSIIIGPPAQSLVGMNIEAKRSVCQAATAFHSVIMVFCEDTALHCILLTVTCKLSTLPLI